MLSGRYRRPSVLRKTGTRSLYKLVLAAADTSKGELQAKVYANFWKLKPAQAVPSSLELKNFACKLWANWLQLDGSAPTPDGTKRVIKRLN